MHTVVGIGDVWECIHAKNDWIKRQNSKVCVKVTTGLQQKAVSNMGPRKEILSWKPYDTWWVTGTAFSVE
jgi:hypothetical protein